MVIGSRLIKTAYCLFKTGQIYPKESYDKDFLNLPWS